MLAGLPSLNCRQNLSCLIDKILRKLPFWRMMRKASFNAHVDASRSLAISLQGLSINILARSSFVCLLIFFPSNSKDLSLEKNKNRELKMDFFPRHSNTEMSLRKQRWLKGPVISPSTGDPPVFGSTPPAVSCACSLH